MEINNMELVDIRSVSIDKNLAKHERIAEYIRQIRNPYRFKCGDFIISVKYSESGPSLDKCVQHLMK